MRKQDRKTSRRFYVSPRVRCFCPSDEGCDLLYNSRADTNGNFNDMESGGDLGGNINGGSNGSKAFFGDFMWDDDLGGTVNGGGE